MTTPSADQRIDVVARLLREALSLTDASLVIHRGGVLVEFKTDLLPKELSVWAEGRHRSWQIGEFDGHHCHLNLESIGEVHFDAEPVPCQGGRINYTVWFLCEHDGGNTHRPRGLFSVTLNRPYKADGTPRRRIIGQVAALFERERHCPMVTASRAFTEAIGVLSQGSHSASGESIQSVSGA
jgi:hypothetical protein